MDIRELKGTAGFYIIRVAGSLRSPRDQNFKLSSSHNVPSTQCSESEFIQDLARTQKKKFESKALRCQCNNSSPRSNNKTSTVVREKTLQIWCFLFGVFLFVLPLLLKCQFNRLQDGESNVLVLRKLRRENKVNIFPLLFQMRRHFSWCNSTWE